MEIQRLRQVLQNVANGFGVNRIALRELELDEGVFLLIETNDK